MVINEYMDEYARLRYKIDEALKDERQAYMDYQVMARIAEGLGLTLIGQNLRAIANDEMKHGNLLQSILDRGIKEYDIGLARRGGMPGTAWTWESEIRYYWTAFHKGSGEIAEKTTPHRTVEKALRDAKHFIRSSWRFPGEVLIEVWDKPNKYSEKLTVQPLASEYLHIPDKYITSEELERSGVIVTVTDAGDTSFQVGYDVTAELFDIENDKMRSLGKRPALGEYHY